MVRIPDSAEEAGKPRQLPIDPCYIFSFAVASVSAPALNDVDSCNLHVQFAMANNSYVPVFVDPDIKNNGGDPD